MEVIIARNHLKFRAPTVKQLEMIKEFKGNLSITKTDQAVIVEGVAGLLYELLCELSRFYDITVI